MAQRLTKEQRIRVRDYNRELKNLRSRVKRAEKAGVLFDTDVVAKYAVQGIPTKRDIQRIKSIRGRELYQYGSIFAPTDDGITSVSGQRAINVLTSQRAQKAAATRSEREPDPEKWLRGFLKRNEVISYGLSEGEKEEFKRKHSQGWTDKLIAQNWLTELRNYVDEIAHQRELFSDVLEEPDEQESIWYTETEPEPEPIRETFTDPDSGETFEVIDGVVQFTVEDEVAYNFKKNNPGFDKWKTADIINLINSRIEQSEGEPYNISELERIKEIIEINFIRPKTWWVYTGQKGGTYVDVDADRGDLLELWEDTISYYENNDALSDLVRYAIDREPEIMEALQQIQYESTQSGYNFFLSKLATLLNGDVPLSREQAERFGAYGDFYYS